MCQENIFHLLFLKYVGIGIDLRNDDIVSLSTALKSPYYLGLFSSGTKSEEWGCQRLKDSSHRLGILLLLC